MGRYQSQFEWHPPICLPSNQLVPLDVQINLLVAAFHLSVSWSSVSKDGGNDKEIQNPLKYGETYLYETAEKTLQLRNNKCGQLEMGFAQEKLLKAPLFPPAPQGFP